VTFLAINRPGADDLVIAAEHQALAIA